MHNSNSISNTITIENLRGLNCLLALKMKASGICILIASIHLNAVLPIETFWSLEPKQALWILCCL